MNRAKLPIAVLLILAAQAMAQTRTPANDETVIRAMLANFLAHADDYATHQNFWADDLMYTGSSGRFTTKQDILKSLTPDAKAAAQEEEKKSGKPAEEVTFRGDDVQIKLHGDTALIAFKLVQQTKVDGQWKDTGFYRNSGTLLYRNGKWQVALWQATKLPDNAGADKK
jgi:hypothetical protein